MVKKWRTKASLQKLITSLPKKRKEEFDKFLRKKAFEEKKRMEKKGFVLKKGKWIKK